MEPIRINKKSLLLGIALYMSKLENKHLKQTESYKIIIPNPLSDIPDTILFPAWVAQQTPYSLYCYWRVFRLEKEQLAISAFVDYFDIEREELVEFFNDVNTTKQMMQNIILMVARRIQCGK